MAKDSIADLNIALRATADKLSSDINRGMKGAQGSVSAGAVALGTVIGAGVVAGLGAAMQGIKKAVSLGFEGLGRIDALDEIAGKAGVAVSAFQSLGYAAEVAGSSQEAMAASIAKMQANIANGNAEEAITRLGLNFEKISAMDAPGQFGEISQKLSEMKSIGDKIDLTKTIFGKGGIDIMNVINEGKGGIQETDRFLTSIGAKLSDIEVQTANLANKEMDRLNKEWEAVGNQLGITIAPAIIMLGRGITDFIVKSGGVGPMIRKFTDEMVNFAAKIVDLAQPFIIFKDLVLNGFKAVKAVIDVAGTAIASIWVEGKASFNVMWEYIKVTLQEMKQTFAELGKTTATAFQEPVKTIKKAFGIKEEPQEVNPSPYGDITTGLAVLPGDEVTPADPSLIGPAQQENALIDRSFFNQAVADLDGIQQATEDALVKSGDVAAKEIADAAKASAAALSDPFDGGLSPGDQIIESYEKTRDVIAAEAAAEVQIQANKQANLSEIMDAADKKDQARRLKLIREKLNDLDELDQANRRSMEQFQSMNRAVVTDMVSAWATGTGKISDIVNQWANRMIQQFIQLSLFGNGGSIGGLTGLIGGAAPGIGGVLKGLFGGGFADGGRPPMGKVSVVGERGPELFVPDSAGRIIPNGRAQAFAGGGGGSQEPAAAPIIINQNFQNGVTRAELAGSMDEMMDQTRAAVAEGVSRGGGYRKQMQS